MRRLVVLTVALVACSTETASADGEVCDAAGRSVAAMVDGDMEAAADVLVSDAFQDQIPDVERDRLRQLATDAAISGGLLRDMESEAWIVASGALLDLDKYCIAQGLT